MKTLNIFSKTTSHVNLMLVFSYVVRLGTNGNTESTITRTGSDFSEQIYPTGNVLHCEEFRDFWVAWTTRDVKFGTGVDVDTNELGR